MFIWSISRLWKKQEVSDHHSATDELAGFPLQIASDRGSEILEVVATQIAFRFVGGVPLADTQNDVFRS